MIHPTLIPNYAVHLGKNRVISTNTFEVSSDRPIKGFDHPGKCKTCFLYEYQMIIENGRLYHRYILKGVKSNHSKNIVTARRKEEYISIIEGLELMEEVNGVVLIFDARPRKFVSPLNTPSQNEISPYSVATGEKDLLQKAEEAS